MPQPPTDPRIGQNIGPYRIEALAGTGVWGPVYRAVQTKMNRTVALRVLDPKLAAYPGKTEHFLEEARAEAQITHGHIVATYEAGTAEGVHYCATEYMDGPPLAQFLRTGKTVNEQHLLLAIIGIARALDFLWSHKIDHRAPAAVNILTAADGTVKLNHILPTAATPSQSLKADLAALGIELARQANQIGPVSKSLSELVERMLGTPGRKPFNSMAELAQTAAAIEQKLFPPAPPPGAAIARVQPRKTKPVVIVMAGLAAVVSLAGVIWLVLNLRHSQPITTPPPPDFGTMVSIPAGEFIYQNGEKKNLKAFAIDKYEVTFGQYKQFLDAIARGAPIKEHSFAPARKDHSPANWDTIVDAIVNRQILGIGNKELVLNWDSPVFAIDWFDAYAYAAWRGKRLPTEEEWEKAARGATGSLYPWGNDADASKCNVNDNAKRLEIGAWLTDQSPFGVIGMAGNVSEWTATATRDTAVVRGGNWHDPLVALTNRWPNCRREERRPTTGFRCAADHEVK